MAGARVPITFRLYKGDSFLREEKLTLPVIKVGKVPSSHLRLDDESVSRMHAVIEVTGPADVSIIDLGSTRGTFVNGQKVNKAKLQSGDTVLIGDIRIEVSVGGADEDEEIPTRVNQSPAPEVVSSSPRPAPPSMPPPAPAPFAPPPTPQPAPIMPAASAVPPAFAAPPAFSGGGPAGGAFAPPPPGLMAPPGMKPAYSFGPAPYAAPPSGMNPMAGEIEEIGGTRAVEVAAMLGDSVVTVKHCMNPRGGKVSGMTIGLFAVGAGALLLALIAFYIGVHTWSQNADALEKFTRPVAQGGYGKPAHAFRPVVLGPIYDFMSFGGLIAGLVLVTWGLARYRSERSNPWFRIGTAPGVEFSSEEAPSASFPLVAPIGDDFVFTYARNMEGEMTVNGQSTPLASLGGTPSSLAPEGLQLSIPQGARIRVKSGKTTYLVSSVAQPKHHPVPLFAALEANVLAYFAGSAIFFLGAVWLLSTVPGGTDNAQGDDDSLQQAMATGETDSQEDPPPPPPQQDDSNSNDQSGGTGTAMALDEGKMGKKDSDRATGQYKMKNNNLDPQLARSQAVEAAKTAGILGAAVLNQGGAFASLTGSGDISSGFDDEDIYGGLLGNEAGEMNGGFGYGRSGFGPGGGGTGWGTIGTGRYGTIGHGSGTGEGYGVGGGRGGMHGRTAAVPSVRIGQPDAVGDLDKAIIKRYIERNKSKIQYCYEKELLASPGLAGEVKTQFFISPNGNVISSNASGVSNNVSSCVAGVIHTIVFPKPKGGGGVQVNYPFSFRAEGG